MDSKNIKNQTSPEMFTTSGTRQDNRRAVALPVTKYEILLAYNSAVPSHLLL